MKTVNLHCFPTEETLNFILRQVAWGEKLDQGFWGHSSNQLYASKPHIFYLFMCIVSLISPLNRARLEGDWCYGLLQMFF